MIAVKMMITDLTAPYPHSLDEYFFMLKLLLK